MCFRSAQQNQGVKDGNVTFDTVARCALEGKAGYDDGLVGAVRLAVRQAARGRLGRGRPPHVRDGWVGARVAPVVCGTRAARRGRGPPQVAGAAGRPGLSIGIGPSGDTNVSPESTCQKANKPHQRDASGARCRAQRSGCWDWPCPNIVCFKAIGSPQYALNTSSSSIDLFSHHMA